MQANRKRITVFVLAVVPFMVTGSSVSAHAATIQKLPTCTDPTGHNLPCMMIISILPPPPNALQCQETSGQILPCSYTTQNLSNGEQIVAITVYVPANFVFSSPTVIKVVVHEKETTKTTTKMVCPDAQILNHTSQKCIDIPPVPPCPKDNVISGKCPPPKPPI
jgi:hypothetical protein